MFLVQCSNWLLVNGYRLFTFFSFLLQVLTDSSGIPMIDKQSSCALVTSWQQQKRNFLINVLNIK